MSSSAVLDEAARRRTFAIISHPDAGKTTLTEKFLLYAGEIEEAGAVRSRKARRTATSDWMEMEQDRGISITTAALKFPHRGLVFNLLDTPGHQDFSEDTYRVLSGVDAAVMVLDGAAGVEPQTRKLFEVCRRRGTPLITFINKMDRPSLPTLELFDDIEETLGLEPTPVTWPVKPAGRFRGVVDRRTRRFHRFEPVAHGSTEAGEHIVDWADVDLGDGNAEVAEGVRVNEELDLFDALGQDHDRESFLAGDSTPVFFGSAKNNFGVELLLDAIADHAPAPTPRLDRDGEPRKLDAPFSGLVFKVQANMDPRHRDRIAFVRVCSGRFERGLQVTCARTGRQLSAKYAHQLFGQERTTVEDAYPGDVIGLTGATDLTIGDTLYVDEPVAFPGLPTFTPEHFRVARPADRSRTKQFRKGLEQLDEEGVIQVLRHRDLGDQAPILAAVGRLQFDVATFRLENEFRGPARLENPPYNVARRTDEDSTEELGSIPGVAIYRRSDGTPLALFRDRWQVERVERDRPELTLDTVVVGGAGSGGTERWT